MSKSKGNIIDPLEIIDDYGTDAMRMALCASTTQAREIDLDRRRFEEFKNFANKVWNGARFVFMNLNGDDPLTAEEFSQGLDESLLGLDDRWILSKVNHTIQNVNQKLTDYFFDQAAIESYEFFWKEFCAYYLELAKPVLFGKTGTVQERKNKQKLLVILLCQSVRLIHPMAPFITEELFQLLRKQFEGIVLPKKTIDPYTVEAIQALTSQACMVAPYPQVIRTSDLNPSIEETFALVEEAIYTIRNIRGEMKLPSNMATDIHFIGNAQDLHFNIIDNHRHLISALVKTTTIQMHESEPSIGFASTGILNTLKISIPLPAELIKQEQERLQKEKEKIEASIEKVKKQLSNQEFVNHAPVHLVEKQKVALEQNQRELQEVASKMSLFEMY